MKVDNRTYYERKSSNECILGDYERKSSNECILGDYERRFNMHLGNLSEANSRSYETFSKACREMIEWMNGFQAYLVKIGEENLLSGRKFEFKKGKLVLATRFIPEGIN
ncbi:hypothetical protein HYW74_04510 [Candidatus Pacearchaeota archaeon]|nr:hypothetical protein [Candidatus Pacearchaeota archaeon]